MFPFVRLIVIVLPILLSAHSMAAELQFRIISTSDIHANLTDYDYYQDQPNPQYGLTRAAALIRQARREVKNSVYVDNGDLIQGSPMADYMAAKGLEVNEVHPAYMALEKLDAVASVVGNHEFDYGLDYLDKAVAQSKVPVLSANVFNADTKAPRYKPYIFKIMRMKDREGKEHRLKIAFIGFTSPKVLEWDKHQLADKILVSDIALTARKYVPLLKSLGADLIIALNHGDMRHYGQQEDATIALSKVEGIDAIVFGEEQGQFPSADGVNNMLGVDSQNGMIFNKPAVMPGQRGNYVGVIDLTLDNEAGYWRVVNHQAALRPIFDEQNQQSLARNDWRLKWALRPYHKATREFMAQPIGNTNNHLYSYLSLVQDDDAVQLVSDAQKDFVQRELKTLPEWGKLPILSATAPARVGHQHRDATDFTEVEQGNIDYKHINQLYPHHHTVAAVKVNGSELKEWLECSAGLFHQLQAGKQQVQPLVNWQQFRTDDFDVIDGVSYEIDVSQPARYQKNCVLANQQAQRIKHLSFNGKPVSPKAEFVIATNADRAYGGQFAGTGKKNVIFHSPTSTQHILGQFIRAQTETHGAVNTQADHNWRLSPMHASAYFETAPSERAKAYVALEATRPYLWSGVDNQGFAVYRFDLDDYGHQVKP